MNRKIVILLFAAFAVCCQARATDYYVATNGSETGNGTISDPFLRIQQAADVIAAGETCYIRGGSYHEEVALSSSGSSGSPIIFTAFSNEVVLLDGTRPVSALQTNTWTAYSGSIYKTSITNDIWQLFADGAMMIPARWPNANLNDGTIWDRETRWAHGDTSSATNGIIYDDPQNGNDLAATGLDISGAMAIMNIGSWKTWTRVVNTHAAGDSYFLHDPVPTNAFKTKHHYYYLEDKLNLLDAENEWFYDKTSGGLYLFAPGGGVPSGNIRGKVQTYAFNAEDCDYIQLRNLDFFSTTVRFYNAQHITLEDCNFDFPSCSRRMLKIVEEPAVTLVRRQNKNASSFSSVINCTFKNTDSHAIHMAGDGNRIENCLFENIDFSATELPSLMVSILMQGTNSVFRRNTLNKAGASSAVLLGKAPLCELNRLANTGYLQNDGALIQFMQAEVSNGVVRQNWFHDTIKLGARFDAPVPPVVWGTNGRMERNVAWNVKTGLFLKGDYHQCRNNTCWDCEQSDIVVHNDLGEGGAGNTNTVTRNTAAGKLSGQRKVYEAIPGVNDHNWNGYVTGTDLKDELRDPANYDFRPKSGSALIDAGTNIVGVTYGYIGSAPDIGAYEYGCSNYWIPGFQTLEASQPIPPDGATGQTTDRDLIWLGGYEGTSFNVYFGMDSTAVSNATPASFEFMGNQPNNIFMPPYTAGSTNWYWRIDTVNPTGTVKGTVWHYTTLPVPIEARVTPLDDTWVHRDNDGNYGSTASLRVRDYSGAGARFSFLKFGLGSMDGGSVASAALRIRTRGNNINDVTVHSVADNNWEEETMTGTNYPAVGTALDTISNVSSQSWHQLDVSGFITNSGIWSLALTTTHPEGGRDFNSKETDYPPELILQYHSAGPNADVDNDSMGDLWEIQYFGSTTSSAGSGDADLDTFLDRDEHHAGTDPTNAASLLVVSNLVEASETEMTITWQSAANQLYTISGKTNLLDVIWIPAVSNIVATPPVNSETVPVPDENAFYRVKAQ